MTDMSELSLTDPELWEILATRMETAEHDSFDTFSRDDCADMAHHVCAALAVNYRIKLKENA